MAIRFPPQSYCLPSGRSSTRSKPFCSTRPRVTNAGSNALVESVGIVVPNVANRTPPVTLGEGAAISWTSAITTGALIRFPPAQACSNAARLSIARQKGFRGLGHGEGLAGDPPHQHRLVAGHVDQGIVLFEQVALHFGMRHPPVDAVGVGDGERVDAAGPVAQGGAKVFRGSRFLVLRGVGVQEQG